MRFTTVLVANRGEIARRIVRAARSSGLRTVAIYVDADVNAAFVKDADVAIRITSYLEAGAIVAAAHASGADAIHPGYGFLAENSAFASAVVAAGLVWIGPSPDVIAAMGDKLEAKERATAAGLQILASSSDVNDAAVIGFPLMVKAAAGGGGKGMRIVADASELDDALAGARREANSSFGDERVFLERYVASSRHVEIQILGDAHGHLVHVGERECSIQRRHQKLVEESPSPALDEGLRQAMCDAALTLARSIGYQSAGTVEFLLDDVTHDFYFLEVNTRLQVEHPVSEAVSGIDLVREQLRLAQGEVLGYDQEQVRFSGHAIEVRLCAEDPSVGFLPATGTLNAFEPPDEPVVRWESGVTAGSVVTVDFDPLLAKVIAYAPSRADAASTLALALERLHLGGVVTNRDFLVATLRNESFLSGDTTTDFIDRVAPALVLDISDVELSANAVAGALWLQGKRRTEAEVLRDVPSGWRNARLPAQHATFRRGESRIDVDYKSRRDGTFDLAEHGSARIHEWNASAIDLEVNGVRRRVRVTSTGDHLYVQSLRGTIDFEVVPRFEVHDRAPIVGGLNAPMPGVILDVRVSSGQRVNAGDVLVVIEAMKMEHVIAAPKDGTVLEVLAVKGQQVDRGAALLTLHADTDVEAS